MFITEKLIGQKFTTPSLPGNDEWTMVGYGESGTQYIIGACWDQASNRYRLNTFKLKEVAFVGQIPV